MSHFDYSNSFFVDVRPSQPPAAGPMLPGVPGLDAIGVFLIVCVAVLGAFVAIRLMILRPVSAMHRRVAGVATVSGP